MNTSTFSKLNEFYFRWLKNVLFTLLFFGYTFSVHSAEVLKKSNDPIDPNPTVYEQLLVNVVIEGLGNFDLDAVYSDKNNLYINVVDLFSTLKIPCKEGEKGISLVGVIGNMQQPYTIDFARGTIRIGDKTFKTNNKIIKESGNIYIDATVFSDVFRIKLDFNFRTLTIKLSADFELPIIKQMRQEKIRKNISKIKNEILFDTLVKRNYHTFKLGTFDWSMASFTNLNEPATNLLGLGFGAELLKGEANVSLNYNSQYTFDNRQLNYRWSWVDNDKKIIKQAQIGKIGVPMIAFINAPMVGAVIRNTPTTVRKAKGVYTINETTDPNWTVELYINKILVDFTTADASGAFSFKVPIVYGYSILTLKYYGPAGEERVEEREMNVPYTIMPKNEFEYGLSAGIVQDGKGTQFSKGEFFYGLTRTFTLGGGIEYVSTISNSMIPFLKATFQPFSKLLFNGEYAHGVRSRGLLNYYITKDILFEFDYAKYVEGQTATFFNASRELKTKLSIPIKFSKVNGSVRLDYSQLDYKTFQYNFANLMLSANYKKIGVSSESQLNWVDAQSPFMTTDLFFSYRLKDNLQLRPSVRYNISDNTLMSYKAEIEKRMLRGVFSAYYERNALYNLDFVNLNYKYDLSFARTAFSASRSKDNTIISASAQGSLAFGAKNNYIHKGPNSALGKGGVVIYPFLDLNQNGIFDKDERLVKIKDVKINGATPIFNDNDLLVRIPDLNGFTAYTISFNDNDLENISWRFKHRLYQVIIDPNQFKRINVPIVPMGEVSGTVYKENENEVRGFSRIIVKVYKKDSKELVVQTLSESDGYIYHLGLKPGDYMACIDPEQLKSLNMTASPPCRYFSIKKSEDGDIVDGLDFVLKENE
ncbi:hypothetical protein SLW70_16090 [Flavobacterium sp. NG2]|uniref:hypothetical protein n=1 Tax=Flavobacterium sp. NG2 TaxID=3097547 RepID=UPI002A822CCE|nr:hypothetical protein [Flavobacterium sp. NG2]WPR71435.1 hypothetical protein SLW70_16090 [Flavobacterium sp. NG2]